jgi:hypothetical protein
MECVHCKAEFTPVHSNHKQCKQCELYGKGTLYYFRVIRYIRISILIDKSGMKDYEG